MKSGGKCAVMTGFGGPEVFEIQERPIPEPLADEVRVKIGATGVAYADIKMRHGLYKTAPKPPMTPGYDFSGVVDAVGSEVSGFKEGDACLGLSFVGANAEYLTMKTDHIGVAPTGLDPIAGAAIPLNYLTAYQMLERLALVSAGDTILVHGGAGGVGTAILDLVQSSELTVFATASAGKHDLIRSYGAIPIDYRSESFVEVLVQAGGANAVFDHIAGKHIRDSAHATTAGGRLIVYGFMAAVKEGPQAILRSVWEMAKLKLRGRIQPRLYAILTPPVDQREYIAEDLAMLAQRVADGVLKPIVGKVLPLDEIASAHQLLEDAEVTGKIVLTVDEKIIGRQQETVDHEHASAAAP